MENGPAGKVFNLIVFVFLALFMLHSCSKPRKTTPSSTTTQSPQLSDEGCYSLIDGSHDGLESFIKQSMNDPDSYQHVKTIRVEHGGTIQVKEIFRGKNKFGAMVVNEVVARVDNNCNVKEIIK